MKTISALALALAAIGGVLSMTQALASESHVPFGAGPKTDPRIDQLLWPPPRRDLRI